jgi:putative transposon-encoded protein
MAALLVLAGCSTGLDPGSGTGTVNFYMSDQPGAIEEFEHLNVTVDEVTFVRADDNRTTYDANATVDLTQLKGSNATAIEQYELESGNYTKVFLSVEAVDGTLTSGESANVKLPSEKLQLNQNFTVGDGEEVDFVYDVMVTKAGNSGMYVLRPVASESGTDVEIDEVEMDTDRQSMPNDGAAATEGSLNFYVSDEKNAIDDFDHLNATVSKVGFQRGGESGNWTEHDVDNRTVDLTELKGDNATLLETFELESGNYTKVFVHVSAVNGTLTDGSSADVKLPSEKLQLNEDFRVEDNATVDFVYDITVVKRGNSGRYNIKPVASESGTDVPIDDVDEREGTGDADDDADDRGVADLAAEFVGNVSAGEDATVRVTSGEDPVANATVTYNGTEYTTDADGEARFTVAENATEVEVTVTFDGAETEVETDVGAEDGGADGSGNTTYAFRPTVA